MNETGLHTGSAQHTAAPNRSVSESSKEFGLKVADERKRQCLSYGEINRASQVPIDDIKGIEAGEVEVNAHQRRRLSIALKIRD